MKKGRKSSIVVEEHGKFACEEPDFELEFGFPVCPECFSEDISCDSVVCKRSDERFAELFVVITRSRKCFCENCECRFRQIGRKKYYFKPLNLIILGSLLSVVAGLVLPFVLDEATFVMFLWLDWLLCLLVAWLCWINRGFRKGDFR